MIIIGDADALIAQIFIEDSNHKKAIQIIEALKQTSSYVAYPITAVAEAVTSMQRKFNNTPAAFLLTKFFNENTDRLISVDAEIFSIAFTDFFNLTSSKKHTFNDCIVAATAKSYKADAIFSFDRFYKSKGFKLTSDLM